MKTKNPNFLRKRFYVLMLFLGYPFLRTLLFFIPKIKNQLGSNRVTVFQSYQVGDFFMALTAIIKLSQSCEIQVVCRPDCIFMLNHLGIKAVPFVNPFQHQFSLKEFLKGSLQAYNMRRNLDSVAFDFNADPRTAVILKMAGVSKTLSYQRPFAWFFDHLFQIPKRILHQSEKDEMVVAGFLQDQKINLNPTINLDLAEVFQKSGTGWEKKPKLILSCWTRKEEKNWPIPYWIETVNWLLVRHFEISIIVPPDGDENFASLKTALETKIDFISGDLEFIFSAAIKADAVICTDNFLGHLGAFLKKPVFWINGSSDANHVRPFGNRVDVLQFSPMTCRPCHHHCVNPRNRACLIDLTPTLALNQLQSWLKKNDLLKF